MNILIGGAWPFANGSLHIGHIAALLPADVLARYHRAKGDQVCFVSGSDCYGTPVAIRAKTEGRTPEEISDFYHLEFCECFTKMGFSFDLYGKTSANWHNEFVKEFHHKMYENEYVYENTVSRAFCENCKMFLADRFVTGICPVCSKNARGDQCEACGAVLEPEELKTPSCAVCGGTLVFKATKHLFLAMSKLEDKIKEFIEQHPEWRKNAISISKRYIDEGLRDRAITRDLDWGIDVPRPGYDGKKIYVWAENVLGYLSASHQFTGNESDGFWNQNANTKHYYVHGKDNIPFHTIILPALLLASGGDWHLPDSIISSEYLTLEGKKISTSSNHAIWIKDFLMEFQPDSIRYFLITNGPEKRDADFTMKEYINSHNGELLGAYGNFVNRTLAFVKKYFDSRVPKGKIQPETKDILRGLYETTGKKIEGGNFREALDGIFEFIRFSNKYFDKEKPWESRNTNLKTCENTIFNCVQIIANLAVLLYPFLPFSSEKVCGWLKLDSSWKFKSVKEGSYIPELQILFKRLEKG
jgi:methionyl-tRNA synthetase